jgi:hypothetical protein
MELPILEDGQRIPALITTTLLPGFLVGLKTSVTGNVEYTKEVIEEEHRIRSGALRSVTQTERTINNPEEFVKANQIRLKARQIITSGICINTKGFGLLCPESRIPKLELAVKEARRLADTFNRTATITHVSIGIMTGRIAQDSVEAVRSIKGEVRELLALMSEGVKNLNAQAVRDAANRARNLGGMLSPEAAAKIKGAIDTARKAARKIAKAGDNVVTEIDREALASLAAARTSFLDFDDAFESLTRGTEPEEPGKPIGEAELPEAISPTPPGRTRSRDAVAPPSPKKPVIQRRVPARAI